MYGTQELVELGERLAEDGPQRHERALLEVAFLVQGQSPAAAAVLADRFSPRVLRDRAFSVAADVLLRTRTEPLVEPEPRPEDVGAELQQLLLDWQGQLVGWGA
jgi:hypothetical protein